jgi:hypothetical protein
MSFSRYGNKIVLENSLEEFEDLFEERGVNHIRQFATPTLRHPTQRNINNLTRLGHTWKTGDRYYKLAHKHYGDANLWWIIAWYNKKPTEAHVKMGDIITIPLPLDKIIRYLGV